MPLRHTLPRAFLTLAACAGLAIAADEPTPAKPDAKKAAEKPAAKPATKQSAAARPATQPKDDWTAAMDYGPFLMASVSLPVAKPYKPAPFEGPNVPKFAVDPMNDLVAGKGIVIPLGPRDANGVPAATVVYDTDNLSMAAAWTGGWLDLSGTMLTNRKGVNQVTVGGKELFRFSKSAMVGDRDSRDNRGESANKFLAIKDSGYPVLSYRVNGVDVSEAPTLFRAEGLTSIAILRSMHFDPAGPDLRLRIIDGPQKSARTTADGSVAVISDEETATMVGIFNSFSNPDRSKLRLETTPNGIELFGAAERRSSAKVVVYRGKPSEVEAFEKAISNAGSVLYFRLQDEKQWEPTTTAGKPAAPIKKDADPSFAVDTLALPDKNPWNSWLRLGGLDFFPDGRAAVCTINGDVWVVSGIDDGLQKLSWKRYATGLYQPLGLHIVDGKILVRGRDRITRLVDENKNGQADLYENLSDEGLTHPSYHGMVFDLHSDSTGNLYYARGGLAMDPNHEGHGRVIKVGKDGKATTIATGVRAPNGIGVVGPNDGSKTAWITVSDNQGNWIPSSKIHLIDPNAKEPPFLGYLPHHHQQTMPTKHQRPLVWLPHKLDTSSGGQAPVPTNLPDGSPWKPYAGQWIHTSFGTACVMLMLPDAAAAPGEMPKQAAVVRLPLDFPTGVMRPRFNPKDGQLYVAGVGGGWQTKGTADGGLYRVRHTGKPGFAPTKFAVVPGGVQLTFPQPLDKAEATDPQNYAVEQWNYKWTEKYGSPDFSAKDPAKAGHDEVEVKSVALSPDGLTVTLKLADLRVVDQMTIECNLKTAAGAEFEQTVYTTINAAP